MYLIKYVMATLARMSDLVMGGGVRGGQAKVPFFNF